MDDVAGRDDGGSPVVRGCGHFVLLEVAGGSTAAARAVEGGGAVVP